TVVRRPITPDGDSPSHAVQQQRVHSESIDVEKTRLIVSYEAECERLRRDIADQAADSWQAREFADDRRRLLRAIADARGETARYRQLLIDLENNAPPLLLDSPGAPDDLK